MHNVACYRPPTTTPGLSQQSGRGGFNSSPTVIRKWTFHAWSTRYTQINPLLTPTLLDWTQFRKEKQNPLGRLEERQRRSFSPKPRGLSIWILADLRPHAPGPWDTRSGLVWGRKRKAGMGILFTKFYQAFCSLQSCIQIETLMFSGRGHWLSRWEVKVEMTHRSILSWWTQSWEVR